ncbi:MAG: TRAP transporter substrate-binding protein DctP [Spirochaetota bacterium]
MMRPFFRPCLGLAGVLLAWVIFPSAADDRLLMRISVENVADHFQARTVQRFSEILSARSGGTILVDFRPAARFFRDADVTAALARGDVEMAAPGIWQFDRSVPDTAALMLPSVYARPSEIMHALVDGPLGASLEGNIEKGLDVKVLGRWLDLGYGQLFGVGKPITRISDIKGRTIRVAGGRGNEERIRALGASPVSIPSPDLPNYLGKGLIDGILSTFETVDSAGLDVLGLRSALEDNEYYPFYVPLVSAAFWKRLTPAQRSLVTSAWDEVIGPAREEAQAAQMAARARLVERGMRVTVPSPSETEATRISLISQEDGMASRLGVTPAILILLREQLARLKTDR